MILFLACDGSDLINRNLPLGDPAQPWACSIAADLVAPDGTVTDYFSARINANGRRIRDGAKAVHGISSADAARSGVSEIVALGMVCGLAAQAKTLVAFDEFHKDLIESLLIRNNKTTKLFIRAGLEFVCIKRVATNICRLPYDPPREDGQFKWPSLDEASRIILEEKPADMRSAAADLQRVKRIYFALREREIVEAA